MAKPRVAAKPPQCWASFLVTFRENEQRRESKSQMIAIQKQKICERR
jgi:hypothetical protein